MQSLCYNNREGFNMRPSGKKRLQIFWIAAGLILTACTNQQKDGDFVELTRDLNDTELNKKLIEQEMKIIEQQRLEEERAEKQKKAKLLTKIRQDNPFDERAKSDKSKKTHNCFVDNITNMKAYRESFESMKRIECSVQLKHSLNDSPEESMDHKQDIKLKYNGLDQDEKFVVKYNGLNRDQKLRAAGLPNPRSMSESMRNNQDPIPHQDPFLKSKSRARSVNFDPMGPDRSRYEQTEVKITVPY